MALVFRNQTPCPLCNKVIQSPDRIVATSHFIADQHDPLWLFSDAAMHYVCFQSWEMRARFVKRFNETVGHIVLGNGHRHVMQDDGTIEQVKDARS